MNILIFFMIGIIIIAIIYQPKVEQFEIKRKRGKGKVKVGTINGTPGPLKESMGQLNEIGGQLTADSKYDTVATDYLKWKVP